MEGEWRKDTPSCHKGNTEDVLPEDNNGYDSSSGEQAWSDAEETALRRKLDWQIVPTVSILYLLCFLDRANIGNAKIQGIEEDLDLHGNRFNVATSIFYVLYLAVEVPFNIILKYVGPRICIPFLVVGFGLVSVCTAFVQNYRQLCGLRALLGIFEGGAMPGIAFFLSTFYKREELYFRIGIFVSSASMAGAFGGLLAAGLSQIPAWGRQRQSTSSSDQGNILSSEPLIHTWRNIFFFEGILTILAGLLAYFILPQNPGSTRFLNDRQRHIATTRLRLNGRRERQLQQQQQDEVFQEQAQTGNDDANEDANDDDRKVRPHHVRQAIFNINNTICNLGFFMCNISVQGLSVFMPTLLKSMATTGYQSTSSVSAQLYTVPVYVVASIISIAVALLSDKTHRRGIYIAAFTVFGITGFAMLLAVADNNQEDGSSSYTVAKMKYAAVYLCATGVFPGGPGFLAWGINNNVSPSGVRAVTAGWIMTVATAGGILAVWAYLPHDGPGFPKGHAINLAAQVVVLLLAVTGMWYCARENRIRERGGRDGRRRRSGSRRRSFDLGYRDPGFRYLV